jgi:hypothetical protein
VSSAKAVMSMACLWLTRKEGRVIAGIERRSAFVRNPDHVLLSPVVGRRLWRGLAQFVNVCASGTRIGEAHNDGERACVDMGATAVRCQRCGDSRIEVSGASPPSTRSPIPEGPFPRVTLGRHLCPSRSTTARQAATSFAR